MNNQNLFPAGWDEARVRRLLEHYESQTGEEAVAEDEAVYEQITEKVMTVPVELVAAGLALRDRRIDQRSDFRLRQRRRTRQADEAILCAVAQQQLVRIGQRRTVIERQARTLRVRRERHDAIGRTLGARVADHEEVVVVV